MKYTLSACMLLPLLVVACNGITGKKNLAHLHNAHFIQSNPVSEKFGDYDLYERMDHYNVPGLSLAVVKEGKIVWAEGYGKADIEANRDVDINTLFQAASVSKPIAALAILKLAEEKRVDLDKDVNTYLEGYKIPENRFTKEKKVTLRAILAHSAGLTVAGFGGYNSKEKIPATNEVLSGEGNTEPVVVEAVPGSRWSYSGGGYTVMQKVVEEVSGKSFEDFMKVEILEPLGMTNSTFAQPLPKEYHANASAAFNNDGALVEGKWHNYPEKAAAGLWTTPTDLARYCIEIQNIASGKNTSGVLKKETVAMMLKDNFAIKPSSYSPNKPAEYPQHWGLGPEVIGSGESLRFQHGGRNEGFKANFTAFAYKGQAIIVMANADNGYDLLMEVEEVLSDHYKMRIWQ